MVYISATEPAAANLVTPTSSPCGGNHWKNTGLLIGACLEWKEFTIYFIVVNNNCCVVG